MLPEIVRAIRRAASRQGWPEVGLRLAIAQESGGDPLFVRRTTDSRTGAWGACLELDRPKAMGVGLLGWSPERARRSGLDGSRESLLSILGLSGPEQVELAERFFTAQPCELREPADFLFCLMGRPDAVGRARDYVLGRAAGTRAECRLYRSHSGLDRDRDGVLTAGDVHTVIGAAPPDGDPALGFFLTSVATTLLLWSFRRSRR